MHLGCPCLARRCKLLGVHLRKAWTCPSAPAGPTRLPAVSRASSNSSFFRPDPESFCLLRKPQKSIPEACLVFEHGAQVLPGTASSPNPVKPSHTSKVSICRARLQHCTLQPSPVPCKWQATACRVCPSHFSVPGIFPASTGASC